MLAGFDNFYANLIKLTLLNKDLLHDSRFEMESETKISDNLGIFKTIFLQNFFQPLRNLLQYWQILDPS